MYKDCVQHLYFHLVSVLLHLMQWVLKLTTVDSRVYLIDASDQATREEWRAAIEERIRLLDPSKVSHVKYTHTHTHTHTCMEIDRERGREI